MDRKLSFSYIRYPESEGLLNNRLPALSACMNAGVSSLLRDINDSGQGGMFWGTEPLSMAPRSPFVRFQDTAKHVPLSLMHGSVVAG